MKIDQFRNIKEQVVNIYDKDIVIFGKNGVGKSNLCHVLARNLINEYYDNGDFERESEVLEYAVAYVAPNRMYKSIKNETNMGPNLELLTSLIINSNSENYESIVGSIIEYYYSNFNEYYDKLKKILVEIYPDILYIDSPRPEDREIYKLSDGHKSIVYIILVLIIQEDIVKQQEIMRNLQLKKIAIIDEIDLNIHFSIQRNIYEVLKSNFSDVRFVISTHSPIFLSSIRKEDANIYKLESGLLNEMSNVYTNDLEEIFNSNFETLMHNNEIESVLKQLKIEYIQYIRKDDKKIIETLKELKNKREELFSNIYIKNYWNKVKDEM